MGLRRRRQLVQIKTDEQVQKMRAAGVLLARVLDELRAGTRAGVSTADLDAVAEDLIRAAGAVPSFKGYQGFPASICASVNDRIVHGIPSAAEVLADGDIISIDCGLILAGWHADSAVTVPVGGVPAVRSASPASPALLDDCAESMWRGIAAAQPGARLSDIGYAIESYARDAGAYGLVREYGGHGIGTEMHQEPFIPNHGRPGHGPELTVGMCLAIEPMLNLGGDATEQLDDGWTVVTADGTRSAHFEHSLAITADGPWVLTAPDGGRAKLSELGAPHATRQEVAEDAAQP